MIYLIILHVILCKFNLKIKLLTTIAILYKIIDKNLLIYFIQFNCNNLYIIFIWIVYFCFIINNKQNISFKKSIGIFENIKISILDMFFFILIEELIFRYFLFIIINTEKINLLVFVLNLLFPFVHRFNSIKSFLELYIFSILMYITLIDTKNIIILLILHYLRNLLILL